MALLSIMALYNYNNAIFDDLQLPKDIDKDVLIPNLLIELAEFEVLYSNYDTMKMAIGFWSKKELPIWEKLVETTKFEYNPIHNFDRTEEYFDKHTRNLSGSNNQTRNLSGSDKETRALSGSNNQIRNLTESNKEIRNLTGSDNETRNLTHITEKDSKTTGSTTTKGTVS